MSETNKNQNQKTSKESPEASTIKVKCLVQQCEKAKLQVKLGDKENNIEPEYAEIEKGAVMFVCFMRDAQESDVDKLAKSVLNVKLSEKQQDDARVSILDMPGSILIIPQATLGGRMKGKMIQYHNNIQKDKGQEYYAKFIELCNKYANENENWTKQNCKILSGTYGIRQIYSTETNGPYLHLIEF